MRLGMRLFYMNDRDIIVVKKIIQYINEITITVQKYDLDYNKLTGDFIVKNAISMCILQIGKLVGKLSNEFKNTYNAMPWKDIKVMRNIAAHNYGEIDLEVLWETVSTDVPILREYCEKILNIERI